MITGFETKASSALQNVDLYGKVAVVIGGTSGIGAAVAIRFSQLGCRKIIITGTNQQKADVALAKIKEASKRKDVDARFVKGDLALVSEMRKVADEFEKAAKPEGIDYLVECQGPARQHERLRNHPYTPDGIEEGFAIQNLSRFALAYLPVIHGALNNNAGVVNIFSAGRGLENLDVDNLYFQKEYDSGQEALKLFVMKSARNSSLIDCFTEELNTRYSLQRFYHMHPGLIASESMMGFLDNPSPFEKEIARVFPPNIREIVRDPVAYSNIPVYFAIGKEMETEDRGQRYFDADMNAVELFKWSKNEENRNKIWEKLRELLRE